MHCGPLRTSSTTDVARGDKLPPRESFCLCHSRECAPPPPHRIVRVCDAEIQAGALHAAPAAHATPRRAKDRERVLRKARVDRNPFHRQQSAAVLAQRSLVKRRARVWRIRRRENFIGIGNVHQMRGRLRGADVEPPVDLHRIAIDQLAIEPPGKRQRQIAFPRSRRTDNGKQWTIHDLSVVLRSTFYVLRSTFYVQRSTFSVQRSSVQRAALRAACGVRRSACSVRRTACGVQRAACGVPRSLLLPSRPALRS